ncbi:MAG: hypothetical protein AAB074_08165 [Planctomycetota bacterium]
MKALPLLFTVLAAVTTAAEEPATAKDRAIAATALLKPIERGSTKVGLAFLVRKDGETGWLLTRDEIVGTASRVEVVLWPGTPAEKIVKGDVVCAGVGYGTVKVTGVAGLPDPMNVLAEVKPRDKGEVLVAGFPEIGPANAPAGAARALKATVTVMNKKDAFWGPVTEYKLAGEFALGDRGGAIIDSSGKAIGLLSLDSSSPPAGRIVPNDTLQAWAGGSWAEFTVSTKSVTDSKARVDIAVTIFSPLGPPKSASISWARAERLKKVPNVLKRDGEWEKVHPDARDSALAISGTRGTVSIDFERFKKDEAKGTLSFQFKIVGPDGKAKWCQPAGIDVLFEADQVVKSRNSNSMLVHVREEPLPPAPGMTPLVTSETFEVKERLRRGSCLEDLHLSPDGAELAVLDLSEGKILRIHAADLTVLAEAKPEGRVAGISVTPDWKSVWVVSQVALFNKEGRVEWAGQVVRYSWPDLAAGPAVGIIGTPREVAATDAGFLAVATINGHVVMFDGAKGTDVGRTSSGGQGLLLHPNQRVVYCAQVEYVTTRGLPMKPIPSGNDPRWEVRGPSGFAGNVAAEAALSSDGRWILQPWGEVFSIEEADSRTDFLKKYSIDPCLSFAVGNGCNTFYSSTTEGTLREYEFGRFVLKREIPIGLVLRQMAIDPAKKRLYGVAVKWGNDNPTVRRGGFVSELVAIDLEKK